MPTNSNDSSNNRKNQNVDQEERDLRSEQSADQPRDEQGRVEDEGAEGGRQVQGTKGQVQGTKGQVQATKGQVQGTKGQGSPELEREEEGRAVESSTSEGQSQSQGRGVKKQGGQEGQGSPERDRNEMGRADKEGKGNTEH